MLTPEELEHWEKVTAQGVMLFPEQCAALVAEVRRLQAELEAVRRELAEDTESIERLQREREPTWMRLYHADPFRCLCSAWARLDGEAWHRHHPRCPKASPGGETKGDDHS